MTSEFGLGCRELASVLADSRGTPDLRRWAGHLAHCRACREVVELDAGLRAVVRPTMPPHPGPELQGDRPRAIVMEALAAHARGRRRRGALVAVAGVLGVAALAVALRAPPRATAEAPLARAAAILATVLPPGGPLRPQRLQEDAELRERCLEAVRHERGVVRRAALTVLALGEVDLDRETLEEVLGTWNEDLETAVELASASGSHRHVAEALELRRAATLQAALRGAWFQAARGGAALPAEILEPFLSSVHASVRQEALHALGEDRRYVPGAAVSALLESAAEPLEVRRAAAACLLARGGVQGTEKVLRAVRSTGDTALEREIARIAHGSDAGRDLALGRLRDPSTPVEIALMHAAGLGARAPRSEEDRLVSSAVADGRIDTAIALVECCRRTGWEAARTAVQALWRERGAGWRRVDPEGERFLLRALLTWDAAVLDDTHVDCGLEICDHLQGTLHPWAQRFLERVRDGEDAESARRAAELLRQETLRQR